jgi:sec-independent protein translocase protein TatA
MQEFTQEGIVGFSSISHWIIVLLVFCAGKLPKVMGDLAKSMKSFKAGLRDEGEDGGLAPSSAAIPLPTHACTPKEGAA